MKPKKSPPDVIEDPSGVYVRVPVSSDLVELGSDIANAISVLSKLVKSANKIHKRLAPKRAKKASDG